MEKSYYNFHRLTMQNWKGEIRNYFHKNLLRQLKEFSEILYFFINFRAYFPGFEFINNSFACSLNYFALPPWRKNYMELNLVKEQLRVNYIERFLRVTKSRRREYILITHINLIEVIKKKVCFSIDVLQKKTTVELRKFSIFQKIILDFPSLM